jgi:hypothetical protein
MGSVNFGDVVDSAGDHFFGENEEGENSTYGTIGYPRSAAWFQAHSVLIGALTPDLAPLLRHHL